jgi:hypothetical protein
MRRRRLVERVYLFFFQYLPLHGKCKQTCSPPCLPSLHSLHFDVLYVMSLSVNWPEVGLFQSSVPAFASWAVLADLWRDRTICERMWLVLGGLGQQRIISVPWAWGRPQFDLIGMGFLSELTTQVLGTSLWNRCSLPF